MEILNGLTNRIARFGLKLKPKIQLRPETKKDFFTVVEKGGGGSCSAWQLRLARRWSSCRAFCSFLYASHVSRGRRRRRFGSESLLRHGFLSHRPMHRICRKKISRFGGKWRSEISSSSLRSWCCWTGGLA